MSPASNAISALPAPDSESRAHSERVAGAIRHAIAVAGGSLSFAEFMQHALYAPGLGYYSAGSAKFGEAGDFVTAPEVSPLFGRVLARQCASLSSGFSGTQILELGAGSGALAVEMLKSLPAHGIQLERYAILEVSADLRQRQEQRLRREDPELLAGVEWLDDLPARFDGVVIANEVADALPVERFRRTEEGVEQLRVGLEDGRFAWRTAPAPGFLADAVGHIEQTIGTRLPAGYVSEVSAGLPAWVDSIAAMLERGFLFLFDYGVTRREYYAPDRSGGWLRCHYRHHAHDDPLILPGIQDLSAWVDFTAAAEAAADAGMQVAGYVNQAQFLLDGGLDAELAGFAALPAVAQLELSAQVRKLTLPGEMGEYFKCLGLSRNAAARPVSLARHDRAHAL